MARSFRLYEKKRGNRRTGSKRFGSLGEALFFAVFFFVGCVGLVFLLATQAIPEWRINHAFIQTIATVTERQGSEAWIRYRVGGETGWRRWRFPSRRPPTSRRIPAPRPLRPRQPARLLVRPRRSGSGRLVARLHLVAVADPLRAISFLLIGGGGLIYTVLSLGKSAERRAALVTRSGPNGRPQKTGRPQPTYPNVPPAGQITDSPGTELAYRLPMAGSPAWTLGLWLAACLLWNGIVSGFAVVAVHSLWEGDPDWVLIGFLVPFLAVGIGLIVVFVRQLVLATAIGPTLLEISDQPLYPGRTCDLLLWQSGRLRLYWLEVLLACDEEATYRHGTNTRNERHRVFQQSVFRRDILPRRPSCGWCRQDGRARFDVQREPLTARFAAEVPAGAMHSFKSEHNEVNWKFIVRGEVTGWPDFQRSFPVIVCPHGYGMSKS